MAANTAPAFESGPLLAAQTFALADTTAKKTIRAATVANGDRIDALLVTTDDTANVTLDWYLNDGSTDYYIGLTLVPLGSGYTTIVRFDALSLIAPPQLGFIGLMSGWTLKAACHASMTTGKTTTVTAFGGPL